MAGVKSEYIVMGSKVETQNYTPFADIFQPCRADETIIAEGKEKERWVK